MAPIPNEQRPVATNSPRKLPVNNLNGYGGENKHRQVIFALARALAKIPRLSWDQVRDKLFKLCPKIPVTDEARWNLSPKAQDAILALGLYLLESGGQSSDQIVPYLLDISKHLHQAVVQRLSTDFSSSMTMIRIHFSIIDSTVYFPEIPMAEIFAFSFNSLLSDVAKCCPAFRQNVFEAQTELLQTLIAAIDNELGEDILLQDQERKVRLCDTTVPLLFGLARAFGRFGSTNNYLLCKLYPPKQRGKAPNAAKKSHEAEVLQKHYSNFRSIIPRSLSVSMQKAEEDRAFFGSEESLVDLRCVFKTDLQTNQTQMCHPFVFSFRPSLRTDLMCHQSQRQNSDKKKINFQSQQSMMQPYDPSNYFFNKFGSSFNQLQAPLTCTYFGLNMEVDTVVFPADMIPAVFEIVAAMLDKAKLKALDNIALDVFNSGLVKVYPYKSLSESMNLVLVSLLRQMVKDHDGTVVLKISDVHLNKCQTCLPDLPSPLVKEIHNFVRGIFLSGQNELHSRDQEAIEKEEDEGRNGRAAEANDDANKPAMPAVINKFKLNVQTNAVCVDILVWATKDEFGKSDPVSPQ